MNRKLTKHIIRQTDNSVDLCHAGQALCKQVSVFQMLDHILRVGRVIYIVVGNVVGKVNLISTQEDK